MLVGRGGGAEFLVLGAPIDNLTSRIPSLCRGALLLGSAKKFSCIAAV